MHSKKARAALKAANKNNDLPPKWLPYILVWIFVGLVYLIASLLLETIN